MYCPNCKTHYDEGKFCLECGTILVEDPQTQGVGGFNIGDGNTIDGGVHVTHSHDDHSTNNTTINNVNNVTNEVTRSEMEVVQNNRAMYLDACRKALSDNILDLHEKVELETLRKRLGLAKSEADELLESVRKESLNTAVEKVPQIIQKKIDRFIKLSQDNDVEGLMRQIEVIAPYAKKYPQEDLQFAYYMVLAILQPKTSVALFENREYDNYWCSYWSYIAYIKTGDLHKAEDVFSTIPAKYTNYPEDNVNLLACAGALIRNDDDEAMDALNEVEGMQTTLLQSLFNALCMLLDPELADDGVTEKDCAFFLQNLFNRKTKREILEEREAEEERKRKEAEEAQRKAEERRMQKDEEEKRRKAEEELRENDEERMHNVESSEKKYKGDESTTGTYNYHPKTKAELEELLKELIEERGDNADLNDIDTSEITDMSELFDNMKQFNGDISKWDVSNVVDMQAMFYHAESFNQDLSKWDVSSVETMESLFDGACSFNGDISDWDVSNVTNMIEMFKGAESFNQDISEWDVRNVENMNMMFENASSFNQDLNDWDVEDDVEKEDMFKGASNMKELPEWYDKTPTVSKKATTYTYHPKDKDELAELLEELIEERGDNADLNDIDTSEITDMCELFKGMEQFNGDISKWDVSQVTDMESMFEGCESFNQDLSEWDVSNVEYMSFMFNGAKSFNQDVSQWDVSNVTKMDAMFQDAESFNQDISEWDVSNVEEMDYMFYGCRKFNQDVSDWDVSNVENMGSMFEGCKKFNQDLNDWDVGDDVEMEDMFSGATNMNELPEWYKRYKTYNYHPKDKDELKKLMKKLIDERGNDGDFNDIDISAIKDLSCLFRNDIGEWVSYITRNFNGDISKWDVSNVTNMSQLFGGQEDFNCDISRWDTSKVTNMYAMFSDANSFNQDISTWNTKKVEYMQYMFNGAENFSQDISKWNVSKVKRMEKMFEGSKLEGKEPKWYKK